MAIVISQGVFVWADLLTDLTGSGSDDGIVVEQVGWAEDQNNWYYCTAVAASTSTWTPLATGGGGGVAGLEGNIYNDLEFYVDSADRNSFPAEGGTTVTDIEGNGTAGTLSAAGVFSDGAFTFTNTDGETLSFTKGATLDNIFATSHDGGTVLVFFRAEGSGGGTGDPGNGRMLDTSESTTTGGWYIRTDSESAGHVRIVFNRYYSGDNGVWSIDNITNPQTGVSDRPVHNGSWTSLAIAYEDDVLATPPVMYLNGTSVSATEDTTPTGSADTDAGNDIYIGNQSDGTITFDGQIGIVLMFDKRLSAREVRQVHNAFAPRFGMGFHGLDAPDVVNVSAQDVFIRGGDNPGTSGSESEGGHISIIAGSHTGSLNTAAGRVYIASGGGGNVSGSGDILIETGVDTTDSGTTPGGITIRAGNQSTGNTPGTVTLAGGDNENTSTGFGGQTLVRPGGIARSGQRPGELTVRGADATDTTAGTGNKWGGHANVRGGDGGSLGGTAGNLILRAGNITNAPTANSDGGDVSIDGGLSDGNREGGQVNVAGGDNNSGSGTGGPVNLNGGQGGATGVGGTILITGGPGGSTSGDGGDVSLQPGPVTSGTIGDLIFSYAIWPAADGAAGTQLQTDGAGNLSWAAAGGGASPWADVLVAGATSGGTNPILSSGDTFQGEDTTGGDLLLRGGSFTGVGAGGVASLIGGVGGTTSGAGGQALVRGGAPGAAGEAAGTVSIEGATGSSSAGGAAFLTGGIGSGAAGGAVTVQGGTAGVGFAGGAAKLQGGTGNTTGAGGDATVQGGTAGATGAAGDVNLLTDSPAGGNNPGGDVDVITGGGNGTGRGGNHDVTLGSGGATSGVGGGTTWTFGQGGGTGAGGSFVANLGAGGASGGGGGSWNINTGAGTFSGTSGGGFNVAVGASVDAAGSAVLMTAGGTNAGVGGAFLLTANNGTTGGGDFTINSGNATVSGNGGIIFLQPGTGIDDHGFVDINPDWDTDANHYIELSASGTNTSNPVQFFTGDRNPHLNVTGYPGSIYLRGDGADSTTYINTTPGVVPGTTWTECCGGSTTAWQETTTQTTGTGAGSETFTLATPIAVVPTDSQKWVRCIITGEDTTSPSTHTFFTREMRTYYRGTGALTLWSNEIIGAEHNRGFGTEITSVNLAISGNAVIVELTMASSTRTIDWTIQCITTDSVAAASSGTPSTAGQVLTFDNRGNPLTTGTATGSGGTVDFAFDVGASYGELKYLRVRTATGTCNDATIQFFRDSARTVEVYDAENKTVGTGNGWVDRNPATLMADDGSNLDSNMAYGRITNVDALDATFFVELVFWSDGTVPGGDGALEFTGTKTTAYTASAGEHVKYDGTAGPFQLDLPASASTNAQVAFKNVTTGTTTITLSGNGNSLEDPSAPGSTSTSVTVASAGASLIYQFDGTEWWIV